MKLASVLFLAFATSSQAQIESRSIPSALRGGALSLAKLDPGWWKATTPPPSSAKSSDTKKESSEKSDGKSPAPGPPPSIFDVKLETCSEFLNMPNTFEANAEYWKEECKAIPSKATFVKMLVGDVTDFFQPKKGKTMCDMLSSTDQHEWSSDGKSYVAPAPYVGSFLGGCAGGWLPSQKVNGDNRDMISFWGGSGGKAGGCCKADYIKGGNNWGKAYKMQYCGVPQALAPVCTPLATIAGSFSANKDFWAATCKAIPMTTTFVKVAMGGSTDYFRPRTGKSYCEMLTSYNQHKWSEDGDTWVDPQSGNSHDTAETPWGIESLGGSRDSGVIFTAGYARNKAAFWGSNTPQNTGGCCYASTDDKSPGFGKSFTLSYCEVPQVTPMNQLVETMHENEASVIELEKVLTGLHTRLNKAEMVNVDASGNVSLARSGMFKLAVKAKTEADSLNSLQKRAALDGTNLDQADDQLLGSEKRIKSDARSVKESVVIANQTATAAKLKEQEEINDKMFKLMDPSNPNSLDATEMAVDKMEAGVKRFKKTLKEEIKTVMVTKMRKTVQRLRKMIHKLGDAGRQSEGVLGTVDSSEPLGADLGLDEE